MEIAVIIPAFNPNDKLFEIVVDLQKLKVVPVIVVDDGSDVEYWPLFDRLAAEQDCVILGHNKNLGKGAALKTGIDEAARIFPLCAGYVTADADGQHSPEDIIRVGEALEAHPDSLVLGARDLSGRDVPFKSRWGNRITAFVFRFATGVRCRDTQTGLRGIPASFAWYCRTIPGSRFEFEINFLLEAAMRRMSFVEVPISTIYLEGNSSSHFRPFQDSARIYLNICRFGLSSLASSVVDITLFTLLARLMFGLSAGGLLAATVLARVLSGGLNFLLNKNWVFSGKGSARREGAKYLLLFCAQMMASWLLVTLLSNLAIPVVLVKMSVDVGLFFASYHIQRRYVFHPPVPTVPEEMHGS